MTRVVCQVLHRPERVTFLWSDGAASFEPYHLEGPERERLERLAADARQGLAAAQATGLPGDVAGAELARLGQQLYRSVFRLDAAETSSASDVRRWLLDRQPETLELLGDAPGRLPWNLLYEGEPAAGPDVWQHFWGCRYALGVGRRVNPLSQAPALQDPTRLLVIDRDVFESLDEAERGPFAAWQDAVVAGNANDLARRLRERVPDVLLLIARAEQGGCRFGAERCLLDQVAEWITESPEGNPDPLVVLLGVGGPEQTATWAAWLADAAQHFNGLVANEVPLAGTTAVRSALAFADRFLAGKAPLGVALRELRRESGAAGLAVSAFGPLNRAVADEAATGPAESLTLPLPATPYRPLEPYDVEDRPLFVGREDEVLRFVSLLDRADTRGVFLHGGPSVGKTSLLLAGVLPYLELDAVGYRVLCDRTPADEPAEEEDYPPLLLRPGSDLLGQLAEGLFAFCAQPLTYTTPTGQLVTVDLPAVLASHIASAPRAALTTAIQEEPAGPAVDQLEEAEVQPRDLWLALREDPDRLGLLLDDLTRRLPYELVLVIDRGEELITQPRTPSERARRRQALDALLRLAVAPARCKVIYALRSEFFGPLSGLLPESAARPSWKAFALAELSTARLVDAVLWPTSRDAAPYSDEVPNRKYGFAFADGLAQKIVDQARDEAEERQLSLAPLVHAVCSLLYEKRVVQLRKSLIGPKDLKAVGGVRGALQRCVEQRLRRLPVPAAAQANLRVLLDLLAVRHRDGTVTSDLLPARELKAHWSAYSPVDQAVTTAAEETNLFAVESLLLAGQPTLTVSLGSDAAAQAARQWDEEKWQKAFGRNRVVDTLWVMIPLIFLAAALSFYLTRRFSAAAAPSEEVVAEAATRGYEKAIQAARGPLYRGALAQAAEAIQNGNALQARQALLTQPAVIARKGEAELRGFEWGYLWRQAAGAKHSFEGHRAAVEAVAVSPDGQTAASASLDGTVRLWDLPRGLPRAVLGVPGEQAAVRAVAFAPDGKTLATGGSNNQVRLWDLGRLPGDDFGTLDQPDKTLTAHDGDVLAVAFGADRSTLASAGADAKVILWDVQAGKEKNVLKEHEGKVYTLAFDPKGRALASAGAGGNVVVWDPASGKKQATLKTPLQTVYALAYAPDGQTLAAGGVERSLSFEQGTVRFLDPAGGERKSPAPLHHGHGVFALAYAADGKTLVSAGKDHLLRLWDVETGKEAARRLGHLGWVRGLAVAKDGSAVVTGGYDRTVKVWAPTTEQTPEVVRAHDGPVHAVAFGPNDRFFASAGQDGVVKIWDPATGKLLTELPGLKGAITSLAFAPDAPTPLLAAGTWADDGGVIKLWELAEEKGPGIKVKELRTLTGHKGPVLALAFQPGRPRLASGSSDKTTILWDVETGKPAHVLQGHRDGVLALAFSYDGKLLFTGGGDRAIRIWSAETGEPLSEPIPYTDAVTALAYLEFGPAPALLSAGQDGLIRLWTFAEGKIAVARDLRAANQGVTALAHRRGFFFTSGWDGTVRSWDVLTGERFTFGGHLGPVRAVAVNADLSLLVSAGQDGTLRLWRAPPERAPGRPKAGE